MIAIVDYGVGNLFSLKSSFAALGVEAVVTSDKETLTNADGIILPGVGAFGDAAKKLRESGLVDTLVNLAKNGKPLMGICLGMQLLFKKSYEFGEHSGLGVIDGSIIKFDESKFDKPLKVPHMGWNMAKFTKQSKIVDGLGKSAYLYFVHSYHAVCDSKFALAYTEYGYDFVSAVEYENVYGFQPHPEKSHESGLRIIKNFMEM